MKIHSVNYYPQQFQYKRQKTSEQPVFKSVYTVDTGSATSRQQVLTLGMLMSNFWVYNPRPTFNKIRNTGVYGTVDIDVKDYKDQIVERIFNNNNIKFTKKSNNNLYA
ncbi:unknown [Clostridium sp. CAG:967]|nr:unknown [Clostridium sp. CAG:967]